MLTALLLALALRPEAAAPRPNVVLVLVENLGAELGVAGDPVDTPNLDALAKRGRRFSAAFAQHPLSVPSRFAIVVGRRPQTTGVLATASGRLDGVVSLPEAFAAAGYRTVRVGRVFGGRAEGAYHWGQTATDAAAALAAPATAPLFLAVGLDDGPTPASYLAQYPPPRVPLAAPDATPAEMPAIALEPGRPERAGTTQRPKAESPDARRGRIAGQRARASYVDAQVGALLAALAKSGQAERTLVVVAGDSSHDLAERGVLQRADMLHDGALRTALIVAGPGVRAPGVASDALVELVDLYPTLTALARIAPPAGLDGRSLAPILEDPAQVVRDAVLAAAPRDAPRLGTSVRTDRYRYTEWPDGTAELFDHQADPAESHNLAASAPPVRGTLAALVGQRLQGLDPGAPTNLPKPAAPGPKHNVVLIVLDDLSARLGCYGSDVKTPNIDRLAARGRRFDRAYCGVAMCSPSRASFLTGQRPEALQVWNNNTPVEGHLGKGVPLQQHFKANGYFVARIGKLFHGRWERAFPWDSTGDEDTAGPQGRSRRARAARLAEEAEDGDAGADVSHWWEATTNDDAQEPDGARARKAVALLEAKRTQPLLLGIGFAKPHRRWVAPQKYFDLYPVDQVRLHDEPANDRDDIPRIALANSPLERPGLFESGRVQELDALSRRRAIAAHNATVSFVDAQVGVVLDALDRLKLWDTTVVALLGDHGYNLDEHGGLWRKDTLFEEALRTPLIVAAPGLAQPGRAASGLVELVDLYPTLVDLAGLRPPPGLGGVSLRPLLDDPERAWRSAAFSFRAASPPRFARSIRTRRYRFTEWPDGSRELFDLKADPGERVNVAAGNPKLVAELRERLY